MKALALLALLALPARAQPEDPFLWLEEPRSERALGWVRAHNEKTLALLNGDRRYKSIEGQVRAVLSAEDRLPLPALAGGWVYNFWQDPAHPRGLWRRARPNEYEKSAPAWRVVLDLDALNAKEKEDWTFAGALCLPPEGRDCLVQLSHGGKDATVLREFDADQGAFLSEGFSLPEAKTDVSWLDADHLLIGTDVGPGSLTRSGYPRLVKLWERGRPLSEAPTLLEARPEDVAARGEVQLRPEGRVAVLSRQVSFWEAKRWLLADDRRLLPLPFPGDAEYEGAFQGRLLALLRSDWQAGPRLFRSGSLVALSSAALGAERPEESASLVFEPGPRASITGVAFAKDRVYIDALQDVQGQVLEARRSGEGWTVESLNFPHMGAAAVASADGFSKLAYFRFESFLVPTTLFARDPSAERGPRSIKKLPPRFDARALVVEQLETASADGTRVPYFVVHRGDLWPDGSHATLLYGYGGFLEAMKPRYLADAGKVWSEAGHVYVLAGIRGGGEYGPAWHAAALKERRQRAFDDFLAVARDLIARGVTSPRRLGIMGGSNGGLLVGAAMTQRPDLFNAVVCQVPLLDMLRYTKIAAGASWIAEYGDPEDPAMREAISKYSPYQNLRPGRHYPEALFLTSTADDRVGPGHARKMAAKLESLRQSALFWENVEGGHGAAADLEEKVKMRSLEFTYLLRRLAD